MELLGFPLSQVLAIFGAAFVVTVALYLLKLRRRTIAVPFAKLWTRLLADKQSTQLFSRLKRLLSLLLALLIVGLIAFALGDPRVTVGHSEGRTMVVLIDASASMQATDVLPNRLAQAKEQALRLIRGMGSSDRMLIAQMTLWTTPVSPLTSDVAVLRESLQAIKSTDVAVDFDRALHFAADVLRGQPKAELLVLSDGVFQSALPSTETSVQSAFRVRYLPIGKGHRNVGIVAFAARRYALDKTRAEVLIEIFNASDRAEDVELTLLGDGESIDVQKLHLKPSERLGRFYESLSGANQTLEARIQLANGKKDDLPADDYGYARLPDRRRAKILCVSRGNLYLQAALLLDEYLDVTEITPEQYPPKGKYDVVLFDGFVPNKLPETNALYLYPNPSPTSARVFDVTGVLVRPFFDKVDSKHPIVRFTSLRDVNVAEALRVKAAPADRVVAADAGGPLIVTGTRQGSRFAAFMFDVRRTDLPLRVAWPLLLLNTIDEFMHEDATYLSSYRTGETWKIAFPPSVHQAWLRAPDGERVQLTVSSGEASYAGTRSGFYHVQSSAGKMLFAVNSGGVEESRIKPKNRLSVGGRTADPVTFDASGQRDVLWVYLILAALVVLMLEWSTYHKRWTV